MNQNNVWEPIPFPFGGELQEDIEPIPFVHEEVNASVMREAMLWNEVMHFTQQSNPITFTVTGNLPPLPINSYVQTPPRTPLQNPATPCLPLCLTTIQSTVEPNLSEATTKRSLGIECPLCLDDVITPVATQCGHVYCQACLFKAIKIKKVCPLCQSRLAGSKKIFRLYL
ncbi:hypothetical protein THRCLA_23466 [Thraustotheca clavata]|uniref:RING-type domain-containing protein n=1 Tax=Thraustotheca clavata TaxID=74557 RepID=A0A1V9Y499_9STRA|nr:hypothetical protein THRCLA_23466 [Thraustotheca clavata]